MSLAFLKIQVSVSLAFLIIQVSEDFKERQHTVFKQLSFCIDRNDGEKFKIMSYYVKKFVEQLKDYE